MSAASLFDHPGLLARAIAEATDDVIFAKDLEGRYRFANPATLKAMGATEEEVIGRTDPEILPPDVARRLVENDRAMLARGEPIEMEETVPLADGSVRYYLTRKMPLRGENGRVVGLLGIARDVTERRMAEAQREATRLKLEMGVQAAGLVMADIDYRTNLNHISAELARLLELGDGELTVPRQAIFDRIHPEDRARYLEAIRHALDPASDGHLAIDVRAMLPSGIVRWLHIRLQIVFEDVGGQRQPVRGICAAREVTTEREAERTLREADRRKDEFIATLAHELRNPLAPIRNGLEILRRVGELPPQAVRTRDMMDRQLSHLVRLVDDLLDVSRVSRGKLELRAQDLTLERVLNDALETCQPAVAASGHALSMDLPREPVHLRGDLTRLAQVFSNLVHNASKYTAPGGRIWVRAFVQDGQAVVQVADNGSGIAAEMLPHVFDLFSQGRGNTHLSQAGLGIGLWLVKRLVELHQGSIDAFSGGPGQGSTFTVRLPVA